MTKMIVMEFGSCTIQDLLKAGRKYSEDEALSFLKVISEQLDIL